MNRAEFRMLSALERRERPRYQPTLDLSLGRSREGRRRRRWWWFTFVVFPIGMVLALLYVMARIAGAL